MMNPCSLNALQLSPEFPQNYTGVSNTTNTGITLSLPPLESFKVSDCNVVIYSNGCFDIEILGSV